MNAYRNSPRVRVMMTLLVLVLVSGQCQSSPYGVITPADPFTFVGETLRLYCNITDPSVREDSSSLSFMKGAERRPSQILSTRAIRLTLPDVALSDEGSYSCLVRTMDRRVEVVGNQTLSVDIKPRQVVNETCRVYNWETMTCTWDMDVRYNHPRHVNISVFWVTTWGQVVPPEGIQQDCPWMSRNSCFWDSDHYMHGQQYSIRIAVTYSVRGHILDEASKTFQINTVELVEPAPVYELKASPRNSTCISLSWLIPRVMHREKSFLQQIKTPDGAWKDITSAPTPQKHEDHTSHESLVCDLDRNSHYDFRVAVLPLFGGVQKGYQSEWKNVSAYTEEDVPSAAPSVCPGCFFEMPNTDQDSSKVRKVRILWKDIPEPSRHGRLTHYKINLWGLKSHHNSSVVRHVTQGDDHLTSADLDLPLKQEDYRVSITGATKKGESQKASYILVPALGKMPKPPERFLVQRNRDDRGSRRLFLSWAAIEGRQGGKRSHAQVGQRHATASPDVSELYIVWCPGSRITWQCHGELEWVRLPPHHVTYELVTHFTDLDPYDLLIGISAQVESGRERISSGIHWSTCVYTRDQKPENAPRDVRFSPTPAGADSLIITWDKPGCWEETGYVTEYLVKYCPSSPDNKCIGDRITLNVSREATSATLPHLARSTKYLAHVVAVSTAGLGPPSDDIWQMIEPETPEEDLSGLVLIVVAIMSFMIVVTSCVCFIRCCYRKKQKIPSVDGLLDIQPTQKCPPNNYNYRDRPLPQPPAEVPVDQHTYGTSSSSARACMKNRGYDKTEAESYIPEGTHCDIPLLSKHNDEHNANTTIERAPKPQQMPARLTPLDQEEIALETLSLLESPAENGAQPLDSAFFKPGPLHRSNTDGLSGSAQGYHRLGYVQTTSTPTSPTGRDSGVDSYTHQVPLCSELSDSTVHDFSKGDTFPSRSHWSAGQNSFSMPFVSNLDPPTAVSNEEASQEYVKHTDNALSLKDNAVFANLALNVPSNIPSSAEPPLHIFLGCRFHHPSSESIATLDVPSQEFCTCDSRSDDSQGLDINANISPYVKRQAPHLLDKRRSFPIEDVLVFPPPPSGPPSPALPLDHAPHAPPSSPDDSPVTIRGGQPSPSLATSSSEYLEPCVISNRSNLFPQGVS